jgi:hypothetical protein
MQVDGRLDIGQRWGDLVIHSLTENIVQFGSILTPIYFFDGRMFSRWIVTNSTSDRGTVHCRKTRIPWGDQLVICGLYLTQYSHWYVGCEQITTRIVSKIYHQHIEALTRRLTCRHMLAWVQLPEVELGRSDREKASILRHTIERTGNTYG